MYVVARSHPAAFHLSSGLCVVKNAEFTRCSPSHMFSSAVTEQWANAGLKTDRWEGEEHMIWEGNKNAFDSNSCVSRNPASCIAKRCFGGSQTAYFAQFWIMMLPTHFKPTQKKNKSNLCRQLTRVWHTATVFTCIAVRFRQKPPNTGADFGSGQIILIQWLYIRDHKSLPHCIRVHHSRSKTDGPGKREEGDAVRNESKSNSHPFLSRNHSIGIAKGRCFG